MNGFPWRELHYNSTSPSISASIQGASQWHCKAGWYRHMPATLLQVATGWTKTHPSRGDRGVFREIWSRFAKICWDAVRHSVCIRIDAQALMVLHCWSVYLARIMMNYVELWNHLASIQADLGGAELAMAHKTSSTSFWPFGSFGSFGNCQGDPRWPNDAKCGQGTLPTDFLARASRCPPTSPAKFKPTALHRKSQKQSWTSVVYGPLWASMGLYGHLWRSGLIWSYLIRGTLDSRTLPAFDWKKWETLPRTWRQACHQQLHQKPSGSVAKQVMSWA